MGIHGLLILLKKQSATVFQNLIRRVSTLFLTLKLIHIHVNVVLFSQLKCDFPYIYISHYLNRNPECILTCRLQINLHKISASISIIPQVYFRYIWQIFQYKSVPSVPGEGLFPFFFFIDPPLPHFLQIKIILLRALKLYATFLMKKHFDLKWICILDILIYHKIEFSCYMACINHQSSWLQLLQISLDSQFNPYEIFKVVIILKEVKMYFLNLINCDLFLRPWLCLNIM